MNRSNQRMRAGSGRLIAGVLGLLLIAAPCSGGGPLEGRACELPPDSGPCDGMCPRWFFNPESGQCEEFIWGCCGGNANNFETLKECQAACPKGLCPADVDGDGAVGIQDLLALLGSWGNTGGPADVNGDGLVDVQDLLELLASWGPCP